MVGTSCIMLTSTDSCCIRQALRLARLRCVVHAVMSLIMCATCLQVSQALLKLWQGCCTGDLSELQRLRMAQHPNQSAAKASVSQVQGSRTMFRRVKMQSSISHTQLVNGQRHGVASALQ